jgi:hypothetical protein
MCEEIMVEVSGCRLSHVFGTLNGHERRSVIGEPYPAIVPHQENTVEGVVYRNVPDWAFDRLDRFEGEMYERQSVNIDLNHLMSSMTHYGTGPAPVFFGSGYVEKGTWWKLGLLISFVNIVIWWHLVEGAGVVVDY